MSAGYLAIQSLEACGAMAVSDLVSTFMTVAEAKGLENVAGGLDPVGTLARMIFYSYDGSNMLHHGVLGWVFLAPIFVVDFFTTKYSTRFAKRLRTRSVPDLGTQATDKG